MITKTFAKNEKGKIEFTERELKELLDEMYQYGYNEGKGHKTFVYTSPSWWNLNKPSWTYTTTATPLHNYFGDEYTTTTADQTTNISINAEGDK